MDRRRRQDGRGLGRLAQPRLDRAVGCGLAVGDIEQQDAVALGREAGDGSAHAQFLVILNEILVIRNPEQLSAIAAQRKPTMLLLPYGIPIAIGTIGYFVWTGMLA